MTGRHDFFIDGPIAVEALEETARRGEECLVVTLQAVIRRDRDGQDDLDHVVYESDVFRAEDEVLALRRDVSERWNGVLTFLHRLGPVPVGQTSLFLAVASARREDALAACHHVMERARRMPGLRKRDVFKSGASRLSHVPHETILLSDDALSLPQS